LAIIRLKDARERPDEGEVSVVIPTFNSARTIEACLGSIKEQNYPKVEVLMVDNCSNDGTVQIASGLGFTIHVMACNRSRARNIAASLSHGTFLLFIDSDMILAKNVIAQCVRLSMDHNYDAIIIPELSRGEGYWARCDGLRKNLNLAQPFREAARFFRRETFISMGGYDESLEMGEDFDLHYRSLANRCRIGRTKASIEHDLGHQSLGSILRKYAVNRRTIKRFLCKDQAFIKQYSSPIASWYRQRDLLTRDPMHGVGFLFLALLESVLQGSWIYAARYSGDLLKQLSIRNIHSRN
jgi:glycosyltransferase involved in cell wall biosynthesis